MGGGGGELALGELAGNGLGDGDGGVRRPGDPHGLVDVAPAGEGVPDGPADAGGRPAEGLNFGGVVVGLVFKHQQPLLLFPVHIHRDFNGAGVDLLRFIQVPENAGLFQVPGPHGGKVHEADRLLGLPVPVDLPAHPQVVLVSGPDGLLLNLHLVQNGAEGGVAAMVAPVGVNHPYFGKGGLPLLLPGEVVLAEGDVIQVHGQAVALDEGRQPLPVQLQKAGQGRHLLRLLHRQGQGLRQLQLCLPAFHRVDDILLHRRQLFGGKLPLQKVDLGCLDGGALPLGDNLDALGAGIGPLVKLAGKGLHPEGIGRFRQLLPAVVQLGLRKDGAFAGLKQLLGDALHVVAVQKAQAGEAGNPQKAPQVPQQPGALLGVGGLFLYIDAKDSHFQSPSFLRSCTISRSMQIGKEIFWLSKSQKRRALTGRFAPLRARLLRRILHGFQVFGTKTGGKFAAEVLAAAIGTASYKLSLSSRVASSSSSSHRGGSPCSSRWMVRSVTRVPSPVRRQTVSHSSQTEITSPVPFTAAR